mgnify:CR=1 FL=1
MTHEGYHNLSKEAEKLRYVLRNEISKETGEALSHGDVSENSEYEYAKQRQARVEAQLSALNETLMNAQIVENCDIKKDGSVTFGSTVHLEDMDTGVTKRFKIVGVSESNINSGKISYKSPLAKELIGKSAGDDVEVEVPAGVKYWEILNVSYE